MIETQLHKELCYWYYFLFSLLLLCLSMTGICQLKEIHADPNRLDVHTEKVNGSHIAIYDTSVHEYKELILMIQGTGASTSFVHAIDSSFAKMGYLVISLDYKNNVISTICSQSRDSSCAYNFRKEILTGEQLSDVTEVDSLNSLLHRLHTFLTFLSKEDGRINWSSYFSENRIRWEKFIVAGHSQGAGHAVMLGKMFKVHKVLIFSGPQDYLEVLGKPSPWLSQKSMTPENRYFAFLHSGDPFNTLYQITNCSVIMQYLSPSVYEINDLKDRIPKGQHILVSNIPTKDPHGSIILPVYKDIWKYMLTGR